MTDINSIFKSFDQKTIDAVWEKGLIVQGYNKDFVRADACKALIERKRYGDTNSVYGWQIDHILAKANGGSDELYNLQPLQWENNEAKGDGPLKCVRP